MDPNIQSQLNEIKATVLQNNELLKRLVKQGRIALWSKIGYWVFLILLTVGAFAIIKPLLSTLGGVYAPNGIGASIKTFSDPNVIKDFQSQFAE